MYNPKHPDDPEFRFPRQIFFLKVNGLWPLAGPAERAAAADRGTFFNILMIFYRMLSYIVIFDVLCVVSWEVRFLLSVFGNLMLLTENMCSSFMGMLVLTRMFHLTLAGRKFYLMVAYFVREIWIPKGSSPRIERICEANMKPYRVMALLLFTLIFIYCVMPFIQALQLGITYPDKPFPFRMRFPFDAQQPWPYAISFFMSVYAGWIVVSTLIAEDSIFGLFITYTCGQYQILHDRIDNIRATALKRVHLHKGELRRQLLQREYLKELNSIAHKQYRLMKFVDVFEESVSLIILVNFVFSTALLCLVCFQLATGKDMLLSDYIKFGIYTLATLSQLFILCWNGDRLIQISAETAEHLYACNWEGDFLVEGSSTYLLPAGREFRQQLQIMIMCSQRPVFVTAGKFAPMSLQSFSKLLSSSMSYFTLLQTMYSKDA